MKIKRYSANLILIGVTVLWGSGFIATKMAIDFNVSSGLINIIRGLLFAVLTFSFFSKRIIKINKSGFKKGLIAGGLNSIAFLCQTVAMHYTTPSNAAFFTISNVLMVPFIVWSLYKKKPSIRTFISVFICLIGMAIITGFFGANITFNIGDVFAIFGALMFAFSITYIANDAREIDYPIIAFMLGITQAIGGLIYFLVIDGTAVAVNVMWLKAIPVLLYLGLFPSFISQTLQVVAQQNTKATIAALIMTLEAVFGSIFSILFGYDKLTWSLGIGGLLIMISLGVSEIQFIKPRKSIDI